MHQGGRELLHRLPLFPISPVFFYRNNRQWEGGLLNPEVGPAAPPRLQPCCNRQVSPDVLKGEGIVGQQAEPLAFSPVS